MLRHPVWRDLISSVVILRQLAGVTLQPFFDAVHLRASSPAEDNLGHVPATLQDVPDIQDFKESAANTATPRYGSHQVEVGLCGEGPEEYNGYHEHLAASHESRCADREVQD